MATLTGENGILTQAGNAKEKTEIADLIERAQIDILGVQSDNNGYITEKQLAEILGKYGTVSGEGEDKILTTDKGYIIKVSDIWNGTTTVGKAEGVSVGDIFDKTGEIEEKLHIGDFINYTAGAWSDGRMTEIAEVGVAANNSTSLPSIPYQFGGFTDTSSRDGNATPYNASYNYVQETKSDGTKQAVTGWRLFDVADDGAITLISAGCPEDYYHPSSFNKAYISLYILTGSVRGDANALGLGSKYKVRNWSMYANEALGAVSARVLTYSDMDGFYRKNGISNVTLWNSGGFEAVYGTRFESLVDNYSLYYFAQLNSDTLWNVRPADRQVYRCLQLCYGFTYSC